MQMAYGDALNKWCDSKLGETGALNICKNMLISIPFDTLDTKGIR